MKKLAVCVVALITLVLRGTVWGAEGMGVGQGAERMEQREWFEKGQQAMAFGRYEEAIGCFEKVLGINSGFTDVYRFIGDAYMKKGMPDSAIAAYTKALDSKAQAVPSLVGLGNGYLQKVMHSEARSYYERALAMQPDNGAARMGLGNVYYETGEPVKALSEYQKGLTLDPDNAEAHLKVGLILQKRAEPDTAAVHFYKAGLLFSKRGDRNGAFKAYEHLQQTNDERLAQLLHDELQRSIR